MTKLSEVAKDQSIILGAYAEPGVGKSEFLASSNTSRAVLFTDRNGLRTLTNARVKKLYPNFDPHIEILKPDDDISKPKAFNYMKDRVDYWLEKAPADFDWFLFDDMTSVKRNAMFEAVSINGAAGRSQTKSKAGSMHDALLPTEADFGTEMGLMESFIKDLTMGCRFSGKNLLMLFHEKQLIVKDNKTKEETFRGIAPLVTGRAAPKQIVGDFDFFLRMTRIGKGASMKVMYQCHPDDIVVAKDRDSVFAQYEYDLTIEKILDRIQKGQLPNSK